MESLLVSGGSPYLLAGRSVEVFLPSTGQHCLLPNMTGDPRYYHTMQDLTVCGGSAYTDTNKLCLSLTGGGWVNTSYLLEYRSFSLSWSSPGGLVLLGGQDSPRTTETVQTGGNSSYGFQLQAETM